MTYLHIPDQGLAKHTIGERRSDHATAQNVHDALRGRGLQAVAQALAYQQVSLAIALRILAAHDGQHRRIDVAASASERRGARPSPADAADFIAVPA